VLVPSHAESARGGDAAATEGGGPPVTERFTLSPSQRRWLSAPLPAPHHSNQHFYLRGHFEPEPLRTALDLVAARHGQLRAAFPFDPAGPISHGIIRPQAPGTIPLDVAQDKPDYMDHTAWREWRAEAIQRGLDPVGGPVARALLLKRGGSRPQDHLLLAAHGLVVDTGSWPILVEDLLDAYQAFAQGREPRLVPATAPFGAWTSYMAAETAGGRYDAEISAWVREVDQIRALDLPVTLPSGLPGRAIASLDRQTTAALLGGAGIALNASTAALVYAGVGRALGQAFARSEVGVDIQVDGRGAVTGAPDVSHTVGRFTTGFPLALPGAPAAAGTGYDAGWRDAITRTVRRLASVPDKGFGYRVLTAAGRVPEFRPRVAVGYHGEIAPAHGRARAGLSDWPAGHDSDPVNPPWHAVNIKAGVIHGELRVVVVYQPGTMSPAQADQLVTLIVTQIAQATVHAIAQG
jgi:hypothetical protein